MKNSKLLNRTIMNRTNTRTIGINTDMYLMNIKCINCLQECSKFSCNPFYFPFPYSICNCMLFSYFQNSLINSSNSCCRCCKCQNKNSMNSCNSHRCMQNYCSTTSCSSCQNCGSKTSCNISETVHQIIQNETVDELEERHENIINVSPISSENSLKENLEKMYSKDETEYNKTRVELPDSNITKFAPDYLEKNYRSNCGFTQKIHTKNEKQIKNKTDVQTENTGNINEKQLLSHLLTPNTTINQTIIIDNDDSDDSVESDNDENVSEDDDVSGKTVIDVNKIRPASSDDRRPTRINLNNSVTSQQLIKRPQSLNRTPDVEMLMMIKALVNTNSQYASNITPPLNKLLDHIDAENGVPKSNSNTFKSLSPRGRVANKNYGNVMKLNKNKKRS